MSVCLTCVWEQSEGRVVDLSVQPSKTIWASEVGVNEASIRRHLNHPQIAAQGRAEAFAIKSGVRILALDIETAPNLAYVWGLWDQNVGLNQLVNSTEMLCFGTRWLGEKEVTFRSTFHDGKEAMLEELHEQLNEADAMMGWNSKGFDSKHIKREFLEAGMLPTSPYKELDLMQVVKSNFRFPSNKLDYVSQRLGVGAKVKHSGFDLWIRCMAGDAEAWEEMKKYQIQDVDLLIDLYDKLLPWMGTSHPNVAVLSERPDACIRCGGEDLSANGFEHTSTGTYRKFQCDDCGTWQRDSKRLGTASLRRI